MNILFIAPDFKPLTGGIAEYTHQIAHHLQLAGNSVTVLSPQMSNDEVFDSNCLYEVQRFNYDDIKSNRIRRYLATYKAIKKIAGRKPIDVIIMNGLISESHICWLASKSLGIPYCFFTYGPEVIHRGGIKVEFKRNLVLRGACKIFCVSSFTQKLVEKLGVQHSKTAVLHAGVSIDKSRIMPDKSSSPVVEKLGLQNKKVILTLSRLIERKGIDKTIEAMNIVRYKIPNAIYIIAGAGPYRETLENLVKINHLEEYVIFAGYIPDDEKDSFYNACDVFAIPNRELSDGDVEGFGIVFLEANAFCKPVIGGRSGGATDAIVDGETGFLVNPTDVEEIAAAIVRLLNDENYAKQIGLQGRKRVEEDFNWEVIVSRMQTDLAE
jgi:phosphatidyl-myo-inositol dimannoside synthase